MLAKGLFIFSVLAHHVRCDILNLGDIAQFNPQLQNPPSLQGSTLWLSGDASDGFDFVLSEDAGAKVKGVLEGCGTLDNQCFNDVRQVLDQTDLQIDGELNKRDFLAMLSKTFRKLPIATFASILMTLFAIKHSDEQMSQAFVPHPIAEAAGVFANPGTEVVVEAQGMPAITLTAPTPAETTLQGPSAPSVTAATTAGNGVEVGELVACLDPGLASRIDELMHRSGGCKDGEAFDAAPENSSRARATQGRAICGAETIITNAQRGGPMNDLLLINPASMAISFAAAAAPVARASQVLIDFVNANAVLLDIPPEVVEMIATFVFALAEQTLVEGRALAAENPVKVVKSDGPDDNQPEQCPDFEKEPLTCGAPEGSDCDMLLPTEPGKYATCKSGEYKDCPCLGPADIYPNIASVEEIADMKYLAELFASSKPPPASAGAACKMDDLTELPASVFSSSSNNVYNHFCESWSPSVGEMQMVVNSKGENVMPEPHTRLGSLGPRAPPPDPSIWGGYTFSLSYKPKEGGGGSSCSTECAAAFENLGTACRENGANDPKLAAGGSLDAGCGVFKYEVKKPAALKVYDHECFPNDTPAFQGDIDESIVFVNAWAACALAEGEPKNLGPGSAPFTNVQNVRDSQSAFAFSMYWEPGCRVDGGQESQSISDPLAVGTPQASWMCVNLQVDNFKSCGNAQGSGGKVRAGCIVYEVKPAPRP